MELSVRISMRNGDPECRCASRCIQYLISVFKCVFFLVISGLSQDSLAHSEPTMQLSELGRGKCADTNQPLEL